MEIIPHDEKTFEWVNALGTSPIVLVCEHASNIIPPALNNLGLKPEDLNRHIAYDIGAAGVARAISHELNAPLILQRFSRLIYDCNRSPEMKGAMPEKSEIFDIPGNINLRAEARLDRVQQIYRPFHHALETLLDARAAAKIPTALISIHSFTRIYHGKPRVVDVGLLYDRDARLVPDFAEGFEGFTTLPNEPYGPSDDVMHLMNLHAAPRLLYHLMIEVGNDLIATEPDQQAWGKRLSSKLRKIATRLGD